MLKRNTRNRNQIQRIYRLTKKLQLNINHRNIIHGKLEDEEPIIAKAFRLVKVQHLSFPQFLSPKALESKAFLKIWTQERLNHCGGAAPCAPAPPALDSEILIFNDLQGEGLTPSPLHPPPAQNTLIRPSVRIKISQKGIISKLPS
jgi:hypothetical protein